MGASTFNFAVKRELAKSTGDENFSDTTGFLADLRSAAGSVAAAPVLIPYAVADTTAQSLESVKNFVVDPGGRGFGNLRSDYFNDEASAAFLEDIAERTGMPAVDYLADQYERNQEGFQLAGDIATIGVVALKVGQGVRGAGALAAPLNTKAGKFVFGDHSRVEKLYDDYAKVLESTSRTQGDVISTRLNKELTDRRKEIHQAAFGLNPKGKFGVGAKVREAIGTEAVLAATLNESDSFFPESMNNWDYAQMGAFGIGLPYGIERLVNAARIRNIDAAVGRTGVAAGRENLRITPDVVRPDEALFVAGIREGTLGTVNVAEEAAQKNVGFLKSQNEQMIGGALERIAKFSDEHLPSDLKLTDAQKLTITDFIKNEPAEALGIKSLHKFDGDSSIEALRTQRDVGISQLQEGIQGKITNPRDLEAAKIRLKELQNTEIQGYAPEGITFLSKSADGFDNPTIRANTKFMDDGNAVTKARRESKKDPWNKSQADITSVYRDMPKNVDTHVKALGKVDAQSANAIVTKAIVNVAKTGRSYLQQDYASSLLRGYKEAIGDNRFNALVVQSLGSKGINNGDELLERVDFHAFRRSAASYIKDFNQTSGKANAGSALNMLDASRRYNLQLADSMAGQKSTLALFLDDLAFNGIDITRQSKTKMDELYRNFVTKGEGSFTKEELAEVFMPMRHMSTELGRKGKSFLAAKDVSRSEVNINNYDDLRRISNATQAETINRLERFSGTIDEELAAMGGVNLVGNVLRNTDVSDEVVRVFEEGVPKIIPGSERATAGNTTRGGDIVATIAPQDANFIHSGNSTFGAARQINSSINGAYETQAKNYIENQIELLNTIRLKDNFADLQSFNVAVRSFNQGWEIVPTGAKGTRAKFTEGIQIKDTPANRKLLESYNVKDIDTIFAKGSAALPDMTHLLNGRYQPVGITSLAGKLLDFMADAEHIAILNRNAARGATQRAMADETITRLPNVARDYDNSVVVFDPTTNEVLDVISNKVLDKAWEGARSRATTLNGSRGNRITSVALASDFKQRTGKTWTNFAGGEGVRNSALIPQSPKAILDTMLQSIVKDWGSVSGEVIAARFGREHQFLDQMARTLREADPNIRNGLTRNPYRDTLNVLMGINTSRPAGNVLYKTLTAADNIGNAVIRNTVSAINELIPQGRNATKLTQAFEDIGKNTGYKPATEFIEKAGLDEKRFEDITRGWNQFTGFWVLRFAEIGQFLLNSVSIPSILPTTIKTMQRRDGESFEQFRTRVGWYADVLGDGAPATMNHYKLMTTAVHDMFTPEGRAIMKEANKFGNLNATIIENHDLIFDGGRKLSKPGNLQKFKNLATKPTDFSENYARTLSYMAGYRMFREGNPKLSTSSLHKLANGFADYNVGDYSKLVRPDNYQGALGSMMGLFQTFFTNYWQRFASALEIKDVATIKTLASTQSALFGVDSLPGYDQFQAAWSNYDGTDTPWHRLTGAFGVDYAETLMTGSLSNIPRLWGADGIALYTRGDTNVRGLPSTGFSLNLFREVQETPSVMVATRMMGGIRSAVNLTKQEGIAPRRLIEQAANASPSRPIRGAIEIINGYTTDQRGNLVNENTRTFNGVLSRLIGSKPTDEARQAETLYRQKTSLRIRNARVATMKQWALSEIRRNDGKVSADLMEEIFTRYYREHRNPATFKTWMRSLMKSAQWSAADRQLYERYQSLMSGRNKGRAATQKERELWEVIQPDPDIVDTLGPR